MAVILDIADAVVAELNNTPFSLPFTAERHYRPRYDLAEMTTLRVSVVPRSSEAQGLNRELDGYDYVIDIAVQQRTDMSQAALDALMTLAEEIADHFREHSLTTYPDARCTEVRHEPVYAFEHLDELRQFTSIVTLTYRVWR